MSHEAQSLILAAGCCIALVAFLSPVWLVILAFAVLAYAIGATVGMSLAVGFGRLASAFLQDGTLGWPDNTAPIYTVGIPLGLLVFLVCMALCFRGKDGSPRAQA
ncbi:hypothetical protein SAMN05216466_106104 [Paraburkholderia phenazinium]|uniref:Uncharacterized protein n=1 Tax=Paraburkholderia phenazinium TaxID=60549 RepID=A0A1G7YA76_9BURK|nr:hypothetical protein [Paraburkholderia phenazinium]SDG93382.1 hypothetical protein SAMN05216466_106104 [Paraburkholderia phenazinium]